MYEAHYREKYEKAGIWYEHRLIDDMVAQVTHPPSAMTEDSDYLIKDMCMQLTPAHHVGTSMLSILVAVHAVATCSMYISGHMPCTFTAAWMLVESLLPQLQMSDDRTQFVFHMVPKPKYDRSLSKRVLVKLSLQFADTSTLV